MVFLSEGGILSDFVCRSGFRAMHKKTLKSICHSFTLIHKKNTLGALTFWVPPEEDPPSLPAAVVERAGFSCRLRFVALVAAAGPAALTSADSWLLGGVGAWLPRALPFPLEAAADPGAGWLSRPLPLPLEAAADPALLPSSPAAVASVASRPSIGGDAGEEEVDPGDIAEGSPPAGGAGVTAKRGGDAAWRLDAEDAPGSEGFWADPETAVGAATFPAAAAATGASRSAAAS